MKLNGDFLNPIGRVSLVIRRDASICQQIAKDEYKPDLGARSLKGGVRFVRGLVNDEYLDIEGPIETSGRVVEMTVDIHNQRDIIVTRTDEWELDGDQLDLEEEL